MVKRTALHAITVGLLLWLFGNPESLAADPDPVLIRLIPVPAYGPGAIIHPPSDYSLASDSVRHVRSNLRMLVRIRNASAKAQSQPGRPPYSGYFTSHLHRSPASMV
jgi:hypothetical protein